MGNDVLLDVIEECAQILNETENLLSQHSPNIPPGLAALNCLNIAKTADSLNIPWAALRFCALGLKFDSSQQEIQAFKANNTSDSFSN